MGRGVAHDEYVSFSVNHGRLYYNEEESDIRGGKIRVEFIKVSMCGMILISLLTFLRVVLYLKRLPIKV